MSEKELTAEQKTEIAGLMVMERLDMMGRLSLDGTTHGGKRDLYDIFGYKSTLSPSDFAFRFKRGDIAERIVTCFPDAVWSNPPEIVDDPDDQNMTEFETAVVDLFVKMNLWSYLRRADILCRLGRFSILLLGYSGSTSVDKKVPAGATIKYVMPYGEANVRVKTWVKDIANERFGRPETYMVTVADMSTGKYETQSTANSPNGGREVEVHHSRILHMAEGLLDNEVYGTPALEKVYNRLDDLEKVVGGGAEVYWMNSRGGLNLNADKDAKIADPEKLTKEAEDYVNQLSRILKTQGMDVTPIQFNSPSPKEAAELIVSLISGATGIPRKILLGSEEGVLASTQDNDNWLTRVDERRKKHNEPYQVRPMIDLLIEIGMLPPPKGGKYQVKWPELLTASEKDQADVAVKVAQAISAYVNAPGADLILTPKQFTVEVLKKPYLEAEIDEIEAEHEQEEEEATLLEVENAGIDHERQKDLVKTKASMTGGLGGGGVNDKGQQRKVRLSEPGSASPKSRR